MTSFTATIIYFIYGTDIISREYLSDPFCQGFLLYKTNYSHPLYHVDLGLLQKSLKGIVCNSGKQSQLHF